MSKKLVVYFSVNGDTREVALNLANVLSALCGEQGRKYLHIIRRQRGRYDQQKTDNLYDYSMANNTTKYSMAALKRKYIQAKENSV